MTASAHFKGYCLYTGHAYTILGAGVFSDGMKYLKMRNPWGTETYCGPLSDDDNTGDWTP